MLKNKGGERGRCVRFSGGRVVVGTKNLWVSFWAFSSVNDSQTESVKTQDTKSYIVITKLQ